MTDPGTLGPVSESSDQSRGHGLRDGLHALIREVGFAQAFSFKYSARPGTPAAASPFQLPESDKDRRLHEIQALLR